MASYRHDEGTFFRVPLPDGTFAYARSVSDPYTAFYNYRTETPSEDLDVIETKPVLFRLGVNVTGMKRWTRIGQRPLTGEAGEPVVQFHQDIFNADDCVIYDSVGNERAARPEECVGLEAAASWEAKAVERRLLDVFEGRPNADAEHLRVRTPPR